MKNSYAKQPGFTIVELLIVIVVIGILAAISIVTYSGITQKAENNKTIAAAEAYLKAMRMYEVEHGVIPKFNDGVCLGKDYPWDYSGSDSGDNQCRSAGISYYKIKGTLNQELAKYVSPLPQPSMQVVGTETSWGRGIFYLNTGAGGVWKMIFVVRGGGLCPSIGGEAPNRITLSGGAWCEIIIGPV